MADIEVAIPEDCDLSPCCGGCCVGSGLCLNLAGDVISCDGVGVIEGTWEPGEVFTNCDYCCAALNGLDVGVGVMYALREEIVKCFGGVAGGSWSCDGKTFESEYVDSLIDTDSWPCDSNCDKFTITRTA